jgi:hypothetical protein
VTPWLGALRDVCRVCCAMLGRARRVTQREAGLGALRDGRHERVA